MLQSTIHKKDTIDLSSAPWTMHEFFAGSGLVAYGLKGMFATVWANDISEQKAAVYEANLGNDHFKLGDIKDVKGTELPFAHLSWASFPCQDLSLAGSMGGIHAARSGLVWEWLRVLDEMIQKPKILLLENVAGLLSTNNGDNYRVLHMALVEPNYARARPSTLLSNDDYYKKLYIDNTDLELFYRSASLGKKLNDISNLLPIILKPSNLIFYFM